MFQGETAITIDDKGRLAIPDQLPGRRSRANAATSWSSPTAPSTPVASISTRMPAWERVRDQVNALPRTKSVSRNLQLKLVGAATFVEPDASGRISLPASHRNAVGIEKKAVLLGMGDKFELWSEQSHLAQIRQTLTDDDLGDGLLELQL